MMNDTSIDTTKPKYSNTSSSLFICTLMIVSILEVLDMTIVNVALPDLMTTFSITANIVSWVATGYMMTAAIFTPLVGSLVKRIGHTKLLLISVVLFGISSLFIALTEHYTILIFMRFLQGAAGASLIPISQSIINESYVGQKKIIAMSIWGIGVMVTPVFGPFLGGTIMYYFGWRAIFFINIPICIVAFFMIKHCIRESKKEYQKLDLTGLTLLCISVGSFQYIIDRGNELGWFDSKLIVYLVAISFIAFVSFLINCWHMKEKSIIDLRIFKNRDFSIACLSSLFLLAAFMGSSMMQLIYLENLLNYSVLQAGLAVVPGGIFTCLGIIIGSILLKYLDMRIIVIVGSIIAFDAIIRYSGLTLQTTEQQFNLANMIRCFGFGFAFIGVLTISLSELPRTKSATGAGIFNLFKNIGASIGISFASGKIDTVAQIRWHELVHALSLERVGIKLLYSKSALALNSVNENFKLLQLVAKKLYRESYMLSFNEVFFELGIGFLIIIPLVIFFKHTHVTKKQVINYEQAS